MQTDSLKQTHQAQATGQDQAKNQTQLLLLHSVPLTGVGNNLATT